MCRPRREFRTESFALEGRLLLAISPQINVPPTAGFEGTTIPGTTQLSQVVTQQDGEATVSLSGYIQPGTGTLQVVVATDPSSPAVGVNVVAVDQAVTFANGASQATVTVPILAGAPNPGEVDVDLTITPIDPPPDLSTSGPLELRILASDAILPPKIVSVQGAPQGIVLTFSKPMDPVGASNVNNYAVRWTSLHSKFNLLSQGNFNFLGPASLLLPAGTPISSSSGSVRLKSARYDPATNSVTLVPKRKLAYSADIIVTQGHQTKVSGRPGHQSNPGPGLTDLEGNPINGDTTPGKFGIAVGRETRSLSSNAATVNGVE
jgi:hypothetical protein